MDFDPWEGKPRDIDHTRKVLCRRSNNQSNNEDWVSSLPPLDEANLVDWDEDNLFEVKCAKCPGKRIFPSQLEEHKQWHARINTLFYLRQHIHQRKSVTPFGPGTRGRLLKLEQARYAEVGGVEDDNIEHFLMTAKEVAEIRYFEGQKYTFGQEFMSREDQGEFLFFDDFNPNPQPNCLQNYFHVETRDDGLWIKSTSQNVDVLTENINGTSNGNGSLVSVAVNGMKQTENEEKESPWTKLMFGDIITLEGPGGKFCDLIFMSDKDITNQTNVQMVSEIGERSEQKAMMIPSSPFNNRLIVETILSFASTSAIKNYRLLSSVCSEEGIKVFKKRACVKIDLCPHLDTTQQLFNFAHDMAHRQMPTWHITIRSRGYFCSMLVKNLEHVASRNKKLLSDFQWLFSPQEFSHNITSLELNIFGIEASNLQVQVIHTILNGVSSTLTNLSVQAITDLNDSNLELKPLKMKQLKHLTLDTRKKFSEFVMTSLLPGCAQLQSLRLFSCDHASLILKQITDCSNGSNGIARSYCHLNSISISVLHPAIGGVLEPLKSFPPQRLKNLTLETVEIDDLLLASCLESILQNQASTLEELKMTLSITTEFRSLRFPKRMANLKKLSISLNRHQIDEFPPLSVLSFGLGLGSRRIDYKQGYPSLSHLQVVPTEDSNRASYTWRWKHFFPILSLFLPTEACPSCREVTVPFHLNNKYHACLNDLETLFPNSKFSEELRAAREMPLYNEEDDVTEDEDEEEEEEVDFDEEEEEDLEEEEENFGDD